MKAMGVIFKGEKMFDEVLRAKRATQKCPKKCTVH